MADGHYLVLARKWRPQTFEDVVGQEHITRTLQNAIRAGRIGHAFLFIGSRGIGKTTSARVLAKALNCTAVDAPTPNPCGTCSNCTSIGAGNNIDVIEIDGASNNSVDDVRQIRENIRMVPSGSRYKIYVIDEVHQLSIAAFNALLKTLEEPPPHAVFVLATTESHKIPATIISRCQRYDFRRVSQHQIVELLRRIVDAEGVKSTDEALYAIARAADGGIRDAESILDQLMSYCDAEIRFQDVFDVLGLVDWHALHTLCEAIHAKDVAKMLQLVEDVVMSGKDLSQFAEDILRYFRNLLVCKSGAAASLLAMPEEETAAMQDWAAHFTLTELIRIVEQFAELTADFDSQLAHRTALEALLIKMSKRSVEVSVDTVLEKIMQLAESGRIEAPAASPQTPAPAPKTAAPKAAVAPAPAEAPAPKKDAPESAGARVNVAAANLQEVWARVVAKVSNDSMNLAAFLPQAKALSVINDTITLEFEHGQDTALAVVEKPDNRAAIEATLAALTENATTYRTTTAAPAAAEEAPKPDHSLPLFESVDKEQGLAALSDPGVSKVVDVFKGQIVDIKKTSKSASDG